jgi:hypothetical protein
VDTTLITQVIREETFDSPEEFLDRLNPRNPSWNNQPQAWAFRGHADASWSLVPSVLRQPQTLFTDDGKPTDMSIAWDGSWVSEITTLAEFVDISDSVALALPDHMFARHALAFLLSRIVLPPNGDATQTKKFIDEFGDWPPSELLGVLGLAQHYGVKTRLLDWSGRANVAAYFAAAGPARAGTSTGFLAVWAMRVEMAGRSFPPQAPNRLPRIEVVFPALSSNSNMAAQRGFFTVDRSKTAPLGLDVTIANRATQLKPEYQHLAEPAFQKFLLPKTQASRLLKLLAMQDVHAATLFPGFGGVARYLNERRHLWPR